MDTGNSAFNSQRSLNSEPSSNVEPTGVAINEREGVPESHASATDKMVGKVQKVRSLSHISNG